MFVVLVVVTCAVVGVWGEELHTYWTSKDPRGSSHKAKHRIGTDKPKKPGHGSVEVKTTQQQEHKKTVLEGETAFT